MTTEKFTGTIESAYGSPVSPALKFEGTYEAFATTEEVRAANEYPKEADIIDFVNNKRKANARQKAMQAVLDANGYVKPTLETDDQLQLRTLYKVFILQDGATEASARAMAEGALGKKFTS